MAEIVYLLGAGASFGERGDGKKSYIFTKRIEDKEISKPGSCININEGLPVVAEIPSRLTYLIDLLEYDLNADKTLIEDLKWLANECKNHATIDTFAKKLYLKKDYTNFFKVQSLISIFFIIEQVINKKDSRYDTFLASVLNKDLEINDKITILTWNYDSQFELAYKEYAEDTDLISIRAKLGIVDLKEQNFEGKNQIFKLNGTANFYDMIDISKYHNLSNTLVEEFVSKTKIRKANSKVSFAWDNEKYLTDKYNFTLGNSIINAKTLVVIGYTFPFFNRDIDRKIFDFMPNLKKIYIQDPNADQIIQNLEPVLSMKNYNLNELKKNIIPKTNTDQFFLPPEL